MDSATANSPEDRSDEGENPGTPGSRHLPILDLSLLAAALLAGILCRLGAATAAFPKPLEREPSQFLHIARISKGLFDLPQQEPGFTWLIKGYTFITRRNPNPIDLRTLTVLVSIVGIAFVFLFARRWAGLFAGFLAALLYAVIPTIVQGSPCGLRHDLVLVLALPFLDGCGKLMQGNVTPWRCALCGIGAGLLVLVRLETWVFVAILFLAILYSLFVLHRSAPKKAWWPILIPILSGLMVTPYLASSVSEMGTPFYQVQIRNRQDLSLEQLETVRGQHNRKALLRAAYREGPLGEFDYLFREHDTGSLARNIGGGFISVFLGRCARFAYGFSSRPFFWWPVLALHLAGLVTLAMTRRGLFVLGSLGLFALPWVLTSRFRFFDPRVLTTTYILFYIGIGALLQAGWKRFSKLNKRRDEPVNQVSGNGVCP